MQCKNARSLKKVSVLFAWFVGLLTDRSGCSSLRSFCTIALLQPSLRAMTAHPMTGFHRTQGIFPCMETMLSKHSYFGKSASAVFIIQSRFFPCPGFSPDSLVQRTSMRVRALPAMRMPRLLLPGSRMCHKSHLLCNFQSQCAVVSCESSFTNARFRWKTPLKNKNRLLETNVTIALKQPKNFVGSGFVVR